ncbi:MAG: hypothetical protein QJR14_09445 [Bacillota bacterium]|nr:hypothetical protein [Bacillota bacterium]
MRERLLGWVANFLLAALVILAFGLNAQLWRLPASGENPRPTYTAPGAVSNLRPGEVLRPVRLLLRGDAGWLRLPDPGSPASETLWRASARLAATVGEAELQRAPERMPEALLGHTPGAAVEILLPAPLPWGSWRALWKSEEAGAAPPASLPSGGPSVDRLLLSASGSAGGGAEGPSLQLAAGDASGWRSVALPSGEAAVAWAAAFKAALAEAAPLEPARLPAGLSAQPDFLGTAVVTGGSGPEGAGGPAAGPPAPRLGEVQPDPEALGRAVFGDMALVRRVELVGGEVLFTDGQSTLRFPRGGGFVLERPSSAGGPDRGLGQAILAAVQEVDRLGGWPAGSVLLAARPLPQGGGWQLAFASRFHGLPLLAPAEEARLARRDLEFQTLPPAAAIDVEVSPSGAVVRVAWHVEQVEGTGPRPRWLPLDEALAAARAAGAVPAGASLADATPAWQGAGSVPGAPASPVWLVTLSDGRLLRLPAAAGAGG